MRCPVGLTFAPPRSDQRAQPFAEVSLLSRELRGDGVELGQARFHLLGDVWSPLVFFDELIDLLFHAIQDILEGSTVPLNKLANGWIGPQVDEQHAMKFSRSLTRRTSSYRGFQQEVAGYLRTET